jgi:hypothetical protein
LQHPLNMEWKDQMLSCNSGREKIFFKHIHWDYYYFWDCVGRSCMRNFVWHWILSRFLLCYIPGSWRLLVLLIILFGSLLLQD